MKDDKLKVGISVGDPNGIGVEIILKTFQNKEILNFFTPIIYGSTKLLSYQKNIFGLNSMHFQGIFKAEEAIPGKINVVNLWKDNVNIEFGKSSENGAKMAENSLDEALQGLEKGTIDVLVMAPADEEIFGKEQANNQLKYLEGRLKKESLVLVQNEKLKIAMITHAEPLSEAPDKLTKENLKHKIRTLNKTLIEDFCIEAPKIAVLALDSQLEEKANEKEKEVINPVIQENFDRGILTFGAYPSDNFFVTSEYKAFDATLAMNQDQSMNHFNTLTNEEGVAFLAGLPYVITTPIHGTSFDIAGEGKADHLMFEQAIFDAIKIYKTRRAYKNIKANALRKINIEDIDSTLDEDLPDEESI